MLKKMLPFPHIYPNKSPKLSIGAFTLVELLIAVSIFSVISIAIYSTFSSGNAVLRRVKNIDLVQQKSLLKLERFSRELRAQVACRKKLFLGAKTKLSFSGNVDFLPSRLTYYYDSSALCLMRVIDRLDEIITLDGKVDTQLKSKPQIFLSKIKEVELTYLYLDLKKNEYSWKDEWLQDNLPIAVKIKFNQENQEYASTIFLPTA